MLRVVKNPPDTDKEGKIKNTRDVCLEKMRLNWNQKLCQQMKGHWSEVVQPTWLVQYCSTHLLGEKPKTDRNEPTQGFPGGSVVKNPPGNAGDTVSNPDPGRSHMP